MCTVYKYHLSIKSQWSIGNGREYKMGTPAERKRGTVGDCQAWKKILPPCLRRSWTCETEER